jgi:hypothetical protein
MSTGAELAAYAQGYADCAGHAAGQLRVEFWRGYAAAVEDLLAPPAIVPVTRRCLDAPTRRRPLHARRSR